MLDDYKELQPIVYKILTNSVWKNKTSHAYLFETKGYPRQMDIALAFAKYLLCPEHHTSQEKSKDCSICNRIESGNFTELKIIEPDGLWIKKEQLSELQEEFSKKSIESNKKVYIINHADKLNASASNSILKFLEEPEDNIVAILLTDNMYQVLNTIISRCQIITFSKMKKEEMKKYYGVEDETLFLVGSYLVDNEAALKEFLEDEKNIEKIDDVMKFVLYLETHGKETLLFSNKLLLNTFKKKEELQKVFQIIELIYKDSINERLGKKIEILKKYQEEIKTIAQSNDIISLEKKLLILMNEEKKIQVNANLNLLIDNLIIHMSEVKEE